MATAPLMTTALTTISGLGNVKYALFALLAVEIISFFVAIKMSAKAAKKTAATAAVVSE